MAFIAFCVTLSMALVYYAARLQPDRYTAKLHFQIATAEHLAKPVLEKEKTLLLSDALLGQVLKDLAVIPSENSRFRGLELGTAFHAENPYRDKISAFRENIKIILEPESAVIGIEITGDDPALLLKMVSDIFEKYKNWRRSSEAPGFDNNAVAIDGELAKKREEFIANQRLFLDAVATSGSEAGLAERKAILDAEIASLKLRYGPKHPAMIEAVRELEELTANGATGETQNAARIEELRSRMEIAFQNLDIAMRNSMLKERNISAQSGFEILPLGDAAVETISKQRGFKLFLAGALAFAVALFYLALRSKIRPIIREASDIETMFKRPVFDITEGGIKIFRQELKLHSDPKLLIVTATSQDDDRSDFILSLGQIAARSGEKVLMLDADLRNPDLQKKLPPKNNRNLVDYLSGQAGLEDVIMRGEEGGLHAIYGTAIPNTALDLISSEKMKTLLLSLREAYDLVLVHAPLAEKGPDARVLGALADQVLYLVQQDKTLRKALLTAAESFAGTSRINLAFVLK